MLLNEQDEESLLVHIVLANATTSTIIALCISICFVRLLFSVNKFYNIGHFIQFDAVAGAVTAAACHFVLKLNRKHSHCQRDKYYPVTYSLYTIGWLVKHHILFSIKLLHFSSSTLALSLSLRFLCKTFRNFYTWALAWKDDATATYTRHTDMQWMVKSDNFYQFNLHFECPTFVIFCSNIFNLEFTSNKLNIIIVYFVV